jgi:hypothetical protein
MADENEIDERHKLFEDINTRWQGDKPNRWIDLSQAVDLVAKTLGMVPAVAGSSLLSEAIPPAVPWAGPGLEFSKYPMPDDEAWELVEFDPSLLKYASFDFRQGLIWIDDGGWDLRNIYIEQNHLEAWLEKKQSENLRKERDKLVRFARKAINSGLRGDKPNRWIELYKAVDLVAETLGMLPGPARELVQKEAIPPAVPWVGEVYRTWNDGTTYLMPTEIRQAEVTGADIHFGAQSMKSPANEGIIFEIHIEQNHLEAWLEKRKAPVLHLVQPDQSSSAKAARKAPGPKAPVQRDAAIRARLELGERPGTSGSPWKTWQVGIRKDCGIAASGPGPGDPLGFGDDAIRKATTAIRAEIEARRLEN